MNKPRPHFGVTELVNEGSDTVQSYLIKTTLAANVENLILLGGRNANGTGNDTYVLGRRDGSDTIQENDATPGNTDIARVGANITASQLWFAQSGNNLEVSVIGAADKFTLSNWYLGEQFHVEQFQTSDGQMLQDSQMDAMVSTMAAYAPPPMGQMRLPDNYATSLAPVLASWH